MSGLVKTIEPGEAWYPVSIYRLDKLLAKAIYSDRGYRHTYALRRNLAYNLQHIEFLDRCLLDIKLSSVLETQTWKTLIIVGCGLVESLLHFLLIANGSYAKSEWELIAVAPGNSKTLDGELRKIDSHIYRKLGAPKPKQMTFDSMLKKAESRKVLGKNPDLYAKLRRLRPLRNKVHLQEIGSDSDTDWNSFNWLDACCMAQVLKEVFTSNIFRPSRTERNYFDYLARYVEP